MEIEALQNSAWFIFNWDIFTNLCQINRIVIPRSSEESFWNHSGSQQDSSLRRLRSEWHEPDEFVKIIQLLLNHAQNDDVSQSIEEQEE